jgi:hypothetical protein
VNRVIRYLLCKSFKASGGRPPGVTAQQDMLRVYLRQLDVARQPFAHPIRPLRLAGGADERIGVAVRREPDATQRQGRAGRRGGRLRHRHPEQVLRGDRLHINRQRRGAYRRLPNRRHGHRGRRRRDLPHIVCRPKTEHAQHHGKQHRATTRNEPRPGRQPIVTPPACCGQFRPHPLPQAKRQHGGSRI